jgi:hypothetical protein
MKKNRNLDKWVGYLSTIAVLFVAITPNTWNIPILFRPWIFLGAVIWIVTFSSGVFSS